MNILDWLWCKWFEFKWKVILRKDPFLWLVENGGKK